MKRFLITSILAALVAAGTNLVAQDYPDEYLGLPGDNLNLYAVMKLFQESETLEGFERALNDENSRINNLDLNEDNYIDYIKVIDYPDGNVHTIVLQAVLGRNESQDVAVFTVERFRDGSVQIQLTGDEALYGRNYIIEPIFAETPNPGYTGRPGRAVRTTTVVVAAWPIVRFIYLPDYPVWHSSWYWGYYPSYWHPWRPFYWHYYYGYHYHWFPEYYSCYHRYDHHRYAHWNDFYYNSKRVYSINVNTRIDRGDYRTTYSRPESRRDGEALFAKTNPGRPLRTSVASTGGNNSRRSESVSSDSRQSNGNVSSASRRSNSSVTNRSDVNNSSGQYSGNSRRSSTSVDGNGRGNSSGNNAATPRSTTTINNRANTGSTAGQRTVTNRRSSGTYNSNQGSGSESGRGNGSVRNSSGPSGNSGTGSSASQNSGSSRRSSVSGSSSGQRAQSSGNPGRSSASVSQRSSSGSSSGQRAQSSGNSRRSSAGSGSSVRQSSGNSKSGNSSKESGKSQGSDNNKTSRRK